MINESHDKASALAVELSVKYQMIGFDAYAWQQLNKTTLITLNITFDKMTHKLIYDAKKSARELYVQALLDLSKIVRSSLKTAS